METQTKSRCATVDSATVEPPPTRAGETADFEADAQQERDQTARKTRQVRQKTVGDSFLAMRRTWLKVLNTNVGEHASAPQLMQQLDDVNGALKQLTSEEIVTPGALNRGVMARMQADLVRRQEELSQKFARLREQGGDDKLQAREEVQKARVVTKLLSDRFKRLEAAYTNRYNGTPKQKKAQ